LQRHQEEESRRRTELHGRLAQMVTAVEDVINSKEQVADHSETFETDEL
jgi:hypothetical protein